MRSPRPGFLSWIVLVAYLAGTAVASRSIVLCREVDGSTTIEIAGDHDECLGSGGFGSENAQVDQTACRESCCGSCPCEDTPLAIEPARVVKKEPSPCEIFAINPGVPPWFAGHPWLHERPTMLRPNERAAAASDVTRRSIRSVVLLL